MICWGDTQAQTASTVGVGTPDEYFAYARDCAAIDFTTHQGNDFILSDADLEEVRLAALKHNDPGPVRRLLRMGVVGADRHRRRPKRPVPGRRRSHLPQQPLAAFRRRGAPRCRRDRMRARPRPAGEDARVHGRDRPQGDHGAAHRRPALGLRGAGPGAGAGLRDLLQPRHLRMAPARVPPRRGSRRRRRRERRPHLPSGPGLAVDAGDDHPRRPRRRLQPRADPPGDLRWTDGPALLRHHGRPHVPGGGRRRNAHGNGLRDRRSRRRSPGSCTAPRPSRPSRCSIGAASWPASGRTRRFATRPGSA